MALTITACTQIDIPEIIRISQQSYREHYTHLWHDKGEGYIKANFNQQKLFDELADANSAFFIINFEGRSVGFVKLKLNSPIGAYSDSEALELERIYLIKEASGKGLGKEVISFVSNTAKKNGKRVVWLKAMDSSNAVEFYKKNGFQIIGQTKVDIPFIINELSGMHIMVLLLN